LEAAAAASVETGAKSKPSVVPGTRTEHDPDRLIAALTRDRGNP
jgi:hypothetical protein